MSNLGDGLQFDFQDFNAPMHHQTHRDTIDTQMGGTAPRSNMDIQNEMTPMTSGPVVPSVPSQIMPSQRAPGDTISQLDAQIQFLQHQRHIEEQKRHFEEQQSLFRNMVPPTPQSLEMQANNQYYVQGGDQSQGMFDRYQNLKEQQDMAFTPLVSPAVTPLDTHFAVDPHYTIPASYFSPLTSPALHAQNETMPGFESRRAGSTNTESPVEMDLDSNTAPKKARKTNVTKTRKSSVRQSPISKPQRKKTATTPILNSQILNELAEKAAEPMEQPIKSTPQSVTSTEDSENASVSPEALSEMPPPPIPQLRSARQSPYIQAQQPNNANMQLDPVSLNGAPSPATPASLFRISPKSKSADGSNSGQIASEQIETFELPESASFPKPQPPRLDTRQPGVQPSSEAESARASAMQPIPSPVFPKPSRPASASESPQLNPKSAATPNPRKTPLMVPRGSKKRSSGSVHVSPALRPKISPNIKPLLPGTPGMSAEDAASRLLTSKSNYQNILEGNTVPGVSYPSELSTNLTSKRTSHKIAEQGRRNRINSALQEIATLLPKNVANEVKDDSGDSPGAEKGDKKESKQSNAPNSKASTVEAAIVYIKQLQQEVAEANRRAEEAEKKLGIKTTD